MEPLVDLPGVGRNLQDHLMSGLSASVSSGFSMDPLAMFYPSTWTALAGGNGPLTHTGCDGIAFVRTERQDIGDPRPDIQFHMIAATLATDRGMLLKDLLGFKADDPVDPWWQPHVGKDTFTIAPTLLRPKSRGAIRLASSDPFAPPLIQANYLTDQQDVDTMVAGLKVGLQLLETEAFKRAGTLLWDPLPLCSSLTLNSDEYLECYVRHTAGTVYHPVGTAALGEVLDSRLRVHGVQGLRVADGSAMPLLVGGNTQAAVIMIGEKAAAMIIEDAIKLSKAVRTELRRDEL